MPTRYLPDIEISLPSFTSVLVTTLSLAIPWRCCSPPFSNSLSGLQTGQECALLPDDLRHVNADWYGGPSSLFPSLSLGPRLPGGPKKSYSAPWEARKKKGSCCMAVSRSVYRNVLLCMPESWSPTHPGIFFFSDRAMNPLSMFLGTKQQKGDGIFQSEYSLGYLLLNFLVLI